MPYIPIPSYFGLYRIASPSTGKIFVGIHEFQSYTKPEYPYFEQRKAYNKYTMGLSTRKCSSFEVIEEKDVLYDIFRKYDTKLEARDKLRQLINIYNQDDNVTCVNKIIPSNLTRKEKRIKYNQNYKQKNSLKIQEKRKISNQCTTTCDCGLTYKIVHKQRHLNRSLHITKLNNIQKQKPKSYDEWIMCLNNMTLQNHNSKLLFQYDTFFN